MTTTGWQRSFAQRKRLAKSPSTSRRTDKNRAAEDKMAMPCDVRSHQAMVSARLARRRATRLVEMLIRVVLGTKISREDAAGTCRVWTLHVRDAVEPRDEKAFPERLTRPQSC